MTSPYWFTWFTAAILIVALSSPALGQSAAPSSTPLRDAFAREAGRLTPQTSKVAPATARWSRVKSLQRGEDIYLTLRGGPALKRVFLASDDSTVTTLNDSSNIIEVHTRDDVAEIALVEWRAPRRVWRYLLGWPGAVGVAVGIGVAAHACETRTPCSVSDRSLAISGAAAAVGAAFAARHLDKRSTDGVVYRRLADAAP